ncbi:hypothetical protein D3C76_424620 [compost metagenome]
MFLYNRLKQVGKYEHPSNPPPVYLKFYSPNYKTFKIANVHLFPLANIKMKITMNFNQGLTPFTVQGRKRINSDLHPDIHREVVRLMIYKLPERSVEYMDNRLSRYSMNMGKCEITGMFLYAGDVHTLIHASAKNTILELRNRLDLTDKMITTVNQYRKKCKLELID